MVVVVGREGSQEKVGERKTCVMKYRDKMMRDGLRCDYWLQQSDGENGIRDTL